MAVAKQKGSNAVTVARALERKLDELRRDVIPDDVHLLITRNYGETANDKVNELISELSMAIVIVVGMIALTLDVFRDLGIAFGAAVLGIYILLVWETSSYAMPLLLMLAIPLTIIGILPGFWLLNLLENVPVGGYANPVFFTATAMIGMIALAGIATRNAILLIEFIHAELVRGSDLRTALIKSGAVRFRPIFLTAGTALLGAWPITLDPVFSGLAWALIFGLLVSTAFTLVMVPVVYWMLYAHRPGHGLPPDEEHEF